MFETTHLTRRSVLGAGLSAAGLLVTPSVVRAQAARLPVSIICAGGNVTLTLQEVMKRQGYMDEFGLDAKYVNVADTSKIIASLMGGDTDLCMLAGFGQMLPAVEKGAKMKVLAGAGTLTPNSVFTARPGINSIKDLEGKTIGTGSLGAVLHQVMVATLQKNSVDPSKVTFVNIGTTADIFRAIVAGVIDAGPCNADVYSVADKYKLHSIGDLWKLLPEYPFQGSFATDATIRNKRETLVRTLAAHAKLFRFISGPTSKDVYVASYVAATKGEPAQGADYWQFIRDNQPYAVNLTIPDERITLLQQLNIQTKVQQKIIQNSDIADMSLAAEALKLL